MKDANYPDFIWVWNHDLGIAKGKRGWIDRPVFFNPVKMFRYTGKWWQFFKGETIEVTTKVEPYVCLDVAENAVNATVEQAIKIVKEEIGVDDDHPVIGKLLKLKMGGDDEKSD